jgi:hypothetical protein
LKQQVESPHWKKGWSLMLWEWRRVSNPEWRRILGESVEQGDNRREEYARWMLREILLDPDYEEPQP